MCNVPVGCHREGWPCCSRIPLTWKSPENGVKYNSWVNSIALYMQIIELCTSLSIGRDWPWTFLNFLWGRNNLGRFLAVSSNFTSDSGKGKVFWYCRSAISLKWSLRDSLVSMAFFTNHCDFQFDKTMTNLLVYIDKWNLILPAWQEGFLLCQDLGFDGVQGHKHTWLTVKLWWFFQWFL